MTVHAAARPERPGRPTSWVPWVLIALVVVPAAFGVADIRRGDMARRRARTTAEAGSS